jgi:hypothetical protein
VLPEVEWRDCRQNQKARNHLKLRAKLVAGARNHLDLLLTAGAMSA